MSGAGANAPSSETWDFPTAAGLADATRPAVVAALLEDFAETAAARDRTGGTAWRERDLIRRSGLLSLTIARALGGAGSNLDEALTITRQIARVDSSLAHLFAFHHFMLATLQFFGPPEQWQPLHRQTAEKNWFWGNALNPLDRTTFVAPAREVGRYHINGTKNFSSGATGSDMLIISALPPDRSSLVVAAIPTARTGVTVHDDWDNIGQRQTDSGRVSFQDVDLFEQEILRHPGPLGSPFASLRSCLGQLILTHIYVGIAEGALAQARAFVNASARPWVASGVAEAGDDPYVLHNFGDYWVEAAAAGALTDAARREFQAAFDAGDKVDEVLRGEVAITIATAKVAAARAALDISARLFEVSGTRATAAKLALDRFWRNARTHTLHDPLDYKLKELGAWTLHGERPKPSFYS